MVGRSRGIYMLVPGVVVERTGISDAHAPDFSTEKLSFSDTRQGSVRLMGKEQSWAFLFTVEGAQEWN